MKESMITVRLQYYINSARALFLAAEVTRVFFPTLFPAHTFLILILQTESYTHMLTDTDHSWVRCSLIDSGITHKVKKIRSRVLGSRVLREDL